MSSKLFGRKRKEKREVHIVRLAHPEEIRLKVRIQGEPTGPRVRLTKTDTGVVREIYGPEPVTRPEEIKPKASRKDIKELLSKISKSKKVADFELPTISIMTAEHVDISTLDILEGPLYFDDSRFTAVYITKDHRYIIQDPQINKKLLEEIEATIDYIFFQTESEEVAKAIEDEKFLDELLKKFDISPEARYLIKREVFGYGVLEPIIRDPRVEDFQIPAAGIPAKLIHRDYGELETNIVFIEEELNRYIEKILTKIKYSISLFKPMASVQLPEGHRLTVAYQREVTTKGPALVLRKFPEKPWSISMLLEKNTLSPEMAAWLMLMVELKKGIMIVGPMGSGKTSTVNAILNFIPRMKTIVTIEDTPELRLYHPYWIQHKTRESLTIEGRGEISMFDLVKHALRESADYLIIGEVRGEEGRIWAQAISTGHGGITTFHAESPQSMLARLTSPPISVEKSLLTALRTIVMTKRQVIHEIKEDGSKVPKTIRRIFAIYDYDYDPVNNIDNIQLVFRYYPKNDMFKQEIPLEKIPTAKQIMEYLGWTITEFKNEYEQRVRLFKALKEHIEKMKEHGIETPLLDYIEVTKLLWHFLESPEKAHEYIANIEEKLLKEAKKPTSKSSRKIRVIGIETRSSNIDIEF